MLLFLLPRLLLLLLELLDEALFLVPLLHSPRSPVLHSPRFVYEDFSFFCSSPDRSLPAKIWQTGYELLGALRECAKATALFVSSLGADLVAEV